MELIMNLGQKLSIPIVIIKTLIMRGKEKLYTKIHSRDSQN